MASRVSLVSGVLAVFAAVLGLHGAGLAAPSVSWGSYLGGGDIEFQGGVAVDGSGNVYIVGSTLSAGWVSGNLDNTLATPEYDGFAVKLNASGGHVWSTYLGDSGIDGCADVAVDAGGNVFIVGNTSTSGWFGNGGAWMSTDPGPGPDGFVIKLDTDGAQVWSTYLGGTSDDEGTDLALDSSGNIYATGTTQSTGWVSGGWDTQYSGGEDGYLVKLNASGGHEWSTFLGGANDDRGQGVSADSAGNVYVGGMTTSPDWIGTGSWDTTMEGGGDGYVVKASPAGAYLWGTYVGGTHTDTISAVAAGPNDTVFATGYTLSGEWVSGGWDTTLAGGIEGFVVRLDMGGTHGWSACFGGQYGDIGSGIAVSGNAVYVAGTTNSGGWVSGGWNTTLVENGLTTADGFVLRLTLAGALVWSGFTGGTTAGTGQSTADDIITGTGGAVYVTGTTREAGWLSGGWNTSGGGDPFAADAYVLKFTDITVPSLLFMVRADAETAILAAGLNIGNVYEAPNPSVPAGQVASQDPVAGASAGAGDSVSFTLSTGPAPAYAPDVVSLTRANAEAAITTVGLTVGTVTEVASDTVPAGLVISQNPAAGVLMAAGAPVSLVVSLGTQTAGATVPNVVGMTRTAAEAAITAANLTVGTVSEATSITVPTGQVISQTPAAGTIVPVVMTTVSFVVSLGLPASVTVPNVVGMTEEAALAALAAAGLVHGTTVTQPSSTVAAGLIGAQNPAAGTSAAPGAVVNLFFSNGPDPDLVADARDALADGFNDADADDSDSLTLTEAQTVMPSLSQVMFNALDTDYNGVLGREELGADNGCGCGGCSCERSSLTLGGLKQRLGDLFLGGLALALLAVMGRRDRP